MQQDLETLLNRWRTGEITREELVALKELLRSELHHDKYLQIFEDADNQKIYTAEASAKYENTYCAVMKQVHSTVRKRKTRYFKIAGIAASIVLLVAAMLFPVPKYVDKSSVISKAEFTGKQYIKLPDGTVVILNDSSYLAYDTSAFGLEAREVELVGEAYFDVAHAPDQPFMVHTQKITTTVLGTAFNIKAYKAQSNVEVSVTRGKVMVGSAKTMFGNLLPNEMISVNKTTMAFKKANTEIENIAAWKSNILILDNLSMPEAAKLISQHFKTNVGISHTLDSCRVTAYFTNSETLDVVLDIISTSKNGKYLLQNGSATISGVCN